MGRAQRYLWQLPEMGMAGYLVSMPLLGYFVVNVADRLHTVKYTQTYVCINLDNSISVGRCRQTCQCIDGLAGLAK